MTKIFPHCIYDKCGARSARRLLRVLTVFSSIQQSYEHHGKVVTW